MLLVILEVSAGDGVLVCWHRRRRWDDEIVVGTGWEGLSRHGMAARVMARAVVWRAAR